MRVLLIAVLSGLLLPYILFGKEFELNKKFTVEEGVEFIDYYLSNDTVSSPQERYFQMKNTKGQNSKKYLFFTIQSQKWLLFDVQNKDDKPFDLLVEMGNLGLHQADYYIFHQDTIIKNGVVGTKDGLKTSTYYDRNIVIPFAADPGTGYSFLIRVHTNAPVLDLPVILWNKKEKFQISQSIELGRGLFYGVLAFFIIVTGLIIFLMRSRPNIYFWLYILSGGILLFLRSGIPLEVFWPGRSYFDFIIRNTVLYLYLLVTLRFLKYYIANKLQSGWHTIILEIAFVLGCVLLLLYLPFTYLNVLLQDTLLIVQMVYINLANILIVGILLWTLPKMEDKFVLISSLIYFLLFSLYLFNPFIEFGFWTGKLVGHIILYSGGFLIGVILLTVTSFRIRAVIRRNQQLKTELGALHKRYTHSLVQGQEIQRRKVAEELHDGIGAHLSAIKMKASSIAELLQNPEERQLLDRILENLDEETHQVREMSHELMPPTLNRYGLKASIVDMIQVYQRTYPIRLQFRSNLKRFKLEAHSEAIIYRLFQQLFETLVHGLSQKAEIRLVILPSVMTVTIQVKYSGGDPILRHKTVEVEDLKALVNILQGRIEFFMSSIWDDELNIEVPIMLEDFEDDEKE